MFISRTKTRLGNNSVDEAISRRASSPIGALAVAAVLVAGQAARAAHIIEFQLQSTKLIELVEHRLLEEEICAMSSFELPLEDDDFILDHIEFPGATAIQRVGPQIQFVVPVAIYTKALSCLYDPNCAPVDYTPSAPLTANIVLNLTAQLDEDGKLNLCVEFDSMQIGGIAVDIGTLDENLAQSLGSLMSPKCSRINVMKSLDKLLMDDDDNTDDERTIKQVGVSANSDLSRIAVRLELDDPADPNAAPAGSWIAFFDSDIAPSAAGMEWSIFMDSSLVRQALAAKFKNSLNSEADIEVLDGPTTEYAGLGSAGARVVLTMELEVDADCPFNNVGVDPAIVTLNLFADGNDPNAIKSDGHISTDLVDSDVLACALSFGPFGLIGLPVIAAVAADQGPGSGDYPDECNQVDDDNFNCKQPVTLPVLRLSKWNTLWSSRATLTLDRLFGHSSGISMGGSVNVTIGLPHAPKKLLSVGNGQFAFGVQGGCSSLHLGWDGQLQIEGDGRICQYYIIDDPYGVYGISRNWEPLALGGNWIGDHRVFSLEFPRIGSNYAAFENNPYPCRVVIRSSAGSQCVDVPAPDIANVNPGAAAGMLAEAKANCLKPFWFSMGVMELLWLVDPPPFDIGVYVRFDDPFVYTQDVSAQVIDMQVAIADPISTQLIGNQVEFADVTMNVTANVIINTQAARSSAPPRVQGGTIGPIGTGAGGGIPAPRSPGTPAMAHDSGVDPMVPVTINQDIVVDLTALMVDGTTADVTTKRGIRQLVTIPDDQLPEGVGEMAFMLDIPVGQWAMHAELTPVELAESGTPQPIGGDETCGQGACGVGGAGAVPFMFFGWMSMKRRRRSRPVSSGGLNMGE